MADDNGGRVTIREVYTLVTAVDEKFDLMIQRLAEQNTKQGECIARLEEIAKKNGENIGRHEDEFDKVHGRIDDVDRRDKWTSILTGIGVIIAGALGFRQ